MRGELSGAGFLFTPGTEDEDEEEGKKGEKGKRVPAEEKGLERETGREKGRKEGK